MPEPTSDVPSEPEGLVIEAVEWLPSGAEGGLIRVRGDWQQTVGRPDALPALCARRGDEVMRWLSLPDPRAETDETLWRGAYLVPATLLDQPLDAMWLEWPGEIRATIRPPAPPQTEGAATEVGGEVIDRAVLAERRARRAEAAEEEHARKAAEALQALEALERRAAELERRLVESNAQREELARQVGEPSDTAPSMEAVQRPAPGGEIPDRLVPPAALAGASAPGEPVSPVPAETPLADLRAELEEAHAARDRSQARADRQHQALTGALASVSRARAQAREWRLRMRTSETMRASDAVRLAVLETERDVRIELTEERRRGRERAEALESARSEALTAATEHERARTDLERRVAEEREAHQSTRLRVDELVDELSETRAELHRVQSELRPAHSEAERVPALEARVDELEASLAATAAELETARAEAEMVSSRLHAQSVARAALDTELARERAARAALAGELDEERRRRTASPDGMLDKELKDARVELSTTRSRLDDAQTDRDAARAQIASMRSQLDAAASRHDGFEAQLEAARSERDRVEVQLRAARAERDGFMSELEAARAASDRAAAEVAAARAEQEWLRTELEGERKRVEAERDELRSELEAARGLVDTERDGLRRELEDERRRVEAERDGLRRALDVAQTERDRAQVELAAARAEREGFRAELEAARAARDRAQAELSAAREREAARLAAGSGELTRVAAAPDPATLQEQARRQAEAAARAAVQPAPVTERMVADLDAAAATLRNGEVTDEELEEAVEDEAAPEQKAWLRHALARYAVDDPKGAGELLAGLLPAQGPAIGGPIDYDLTIREIGTFAVMVWSRRARVQRLTGPRSRREAAFHLQTDARTLAELLAGGGRVKRFRGSARISGKRRRAKVLNALPVSALSLADAARAGARLDPGPVLRALRYAIDPEWTIGHSFTVAQRILDPDPEIWYVCVRDGKPLAVSDVAPLSGVDATVTMSRDTYGAILRGEKLAPGERPNVRGDYGAVALLKAWTDRAQCAENHS